MLHLKRFPQCTGRRQLFRERWPHSKGTLRHELFTHWRTVSFSRLLINPPTTDPLPRGGAGRAGGERRGVRLEPQRAGEHREGGRSWQAPLHDTGNQEDHRAFSGCVSSKILIQDSFACRLSKMMSEVHLPEHFDRLSAVVYAVTVSKTNIKMLL